MMSRSAPKIIAMALALAFSLPIAGALADDAEVDAAIESNLGDTAAYRAVIDALQTAVKAGDAAAVAALVQYPIGVTIDGKKQTITDAKDFVAHYDAIITPEIATVVDDQKYADLFVNYQGIMFGRGQVWINGICKDDGCKQFDARIVTIQSGPDNTPAAATPAAPATAGVLKTFKDWKVGCDNIRSCTALGLNPDSESMSGYLKITREGDAEAVPALLFTTWPDDQDVKVTKPSVKLAIDHKSEGLLADPLPAELDGDLVRLEVPDDAVPDILAALRSAKLITLELHDDGKVISSQDISLAGASAALLYMDDEQKRIGTVTALAKPGDADASTIPPLPPLPVLTSLPVEQLADPLPKTPRTAAKPSDDCMEGSDPYVAFGLPGGAALWGACASTGAYNFAYDFRLFVGGKPGKPWSFAVPGVKPDDPSWLWNPSVDEESKTLSSSFKGRGLGDCGDETQWAFDGKGFAALSYKSMGDCRGVLGDDWPRLYQARKG